MLIIVRKSSAHMITVKNDVILFQELAFNCSKLTIEILEKGVKYVQS